MYVVQWLSCVWLFVTPWTAARQASLSFTISWSLVKLFPLSWWCHPTILALCHPLLLLPSIFPRISVFSNESAFRIRWPKDWNFSFRIKESWMLKNQCFLTVVLEKTLASPLDSKEVKPVNLKENQPWIFIGRTDAGAEASILRLVDVKGWLTGKDYHAGKNWRQEEKGSNRGWDGWMASLIQQTWTWANSGSWWGREAWCVVARHGL